MRISRLEAFPAWLTLAEMNSDLRHTESSKMIPFPPGMKAKCISYYAEDSNNAHNGATATILTTDQAHV